MDKRGEVSVCSEDGEIVSLWAERGERLVLSTVLLYNKCCDIYESHMELVERISNG